jgi:hypothetical protein
MSSYANDDTRTNHRNHAVRDVRPSTVETKPAFKTTEIVVWAASVLAVLIASMIVDDRGVQGFGADHAWKYVTWLSIGYMISRGLAKAGSYQKDDDPRS